MKFFRIIGQRNPYIAFIFTFLFSPLLGMLYLERWKIFLLYSGLYLILGLLIIYDFVLYSDFCAYMLCFFGAIHAFVIARRAEYKKMHWVAKIASVLLAGFVFLMIFAIFIRIFVFQPFYIPATSMRPTFNTVDVFLASKYEYGYSRYSLPFYLKLWNGRILSRSPERGDIIVFALASDPEILYVKRVVGLPGDDVQIYQGRLYLDSKLVTREKIEVLDDGLTLYRELWPNKRSYEILEKSDHEASDNTELFHVPDDHFFVLGDNRDDSRDSRRMHGTFVHKDYIVGKAKYIIWDATTQSVSFRLIE